MHRAVSPRGRTADIPRTNRAVYISGTHECSPGAKYQKGVSAERRNDPTATSKAIYFLLLLLLLLLALGFDVFQPPAAIPECCGAGSVALKFTAMVDGVGKWPPAALSGFIPPGLLNTPLCELLPTGHVSP
jgi:hypothetical protein